MNNKIKELIVEATNIEEHGWGASYENFDREKFAQLIVRECMSNLYLNGYDDAMIQIKEHFGIR